MVLAVKTVQKLVHMVASFEKESSEMLEMCKYTEKKGRGLVIVFSHRVNWGTLPLRNGTKKRVIFSISLMSSGVETCFSFSKNVWT